MAREELEDIIDKTNFVSLCESLVHSLPNILDIEIFLIIYLEKVGNSKSI